MRKIKLNFKIYDVKTDLVLKTTPVRTRDNKRQHEYNTTQHKTARVQHDTRVQHETTRVQDEYKT